MAAEAPGQEKCPQNSFGIKGDECEFWDQQELKLQELPEDVPLGDMPRHVTVMVNRELCDQFQPGHRITVLGVLVASEKKGKGSGRGGAASGQQSGIKFSYIQGLGLCQNKQQNTGGLRSEFIIVKIFMFIVLR